MDRRDATALLDSLLGIDATLAQMEAVEQRLRTDPDQALRTFGSNGHRHRKGLQVTIAAIRQHLKYSA
jgi:hypothetical protein